jgi:hypothetical protein
MLASLAGGGKTEEAPVKRDKQFEYLITDNTTLIDNKIKNIKIAYSNINVKSFDYVYYNYNLS